MNDAIARASPSMSPTAVEVHEDPDDWLNIDVNDFDEMLERTVGKNVRSRSDRDDDSMDVDAGDEMAKRQASRLRPRRLPSVTLSGICSSAVRAPSVLSEEQSSMGEPHS